MSSRNYPDTSQRIHPALRTASITSIDYVLPALRVAKESVTGLGVPGLEAALGGTLKIFEMVQVGHVLVQIPTASLYLFPVHRQ